MQIAPVPDAGRESIGIGDQNAIAFAGGAVLHATLRERNLNEVLRLPVVLSVLL